jgi:general secretion pathway protein C
MQLVDRIVAPFRGAESTLSRRALAAAPAALTVVLVIVLAAQLADLLWRVMASPGTEEMLPPVVPGAAVSAVDLESIVNAHLFGIASLSGDPGSAPATTANLALAGTLAGMNPEQGWAIIGASAQAARVYATGTTLPGGSRLLQVHPDRVILDRNGARESLMLPRLSGGSAASPPAAYRHPAAPPGSLVDSVRELMASDQSTANELLRPQPVFAGGQLRGYRVYPGRNRAQFAKLGLQPGDLVTALNGAPLDDPNRALETLRGIGAGPAVTLTVERNGQPRQLAIDPATVVPEIPPAPEELPMAESELME